MVPKNIKHIDAEQVSKIHAKRIQNDANMDAEINEFSYFFEKGENAPDPLFSHINRGSGHTESDEISRKINAKSMLEEVMQKL